MKFLKLLRFAPVFVLLFATACASSSPDKPKTYTLNTVDDSHCSSFHDGKFANLVLEYYQADTIYMKRPDAHEGNFLTIFSRDNIIAEVKRRVPQRDVATIVIGFMYSAEQQDALIKDWEGVMHDCGFQRVVFLRAGRRNAPIDGLPVLADSYIAGLNEPPRLATATTSKPVAHP